MGKTIDTASSRLKSTIFRATVLPAIGMVIAAVILISLVAYLVHTMYWLNHSNSVIAQISGTEKALLDLQTSTRGYLLTKDQQFLAPYKASYQRVQPMLEELGTMVADNPLQAQRVSTLKKAVDEWVAGIDATLKQVVDSKTVIPEVYDDRAGFEIIRKTSGELLNNEIALRDDRLSWSIHSALWTVGFALAGTIGLALLQATYSRTHLRGVADAYRETLILSESRAQMLRTALGDLDRELKSVGDIQRSLLPIELPQIPDMTIAASYQTSRRVGGDYYDFIKLRSDIDGGKERWGILIADVAGHGTPAAVLMAVTHAIAHGFKDPISSPSEMLRYVNQRLCEGYTRLNGVFITAFYAIYEPETRKFTYSCAGHNPPRLRRRGQQTFLELNSAQSLPLGIDHDEEYTSSSLTLKPGDLLVLYTDGIIEARDKSGELFGLERLDEAINRPAETCSETLKTALDAVTAHTGDKIPDDDRTLVVLRMSHWNEPIDPEAGQAVVVDSHAVPILHGVVSGTESH